MKALLGFWKVALWRLFEMIGACRYRGKEFEITEIEGLYFISIEGTVTQKHLNANECIRYLINCMANTPETRDGYTAWL